MKTDNHLLWFKDLRKEDVALVGGKCANLGELIGRVEAPVPNGFAVSVTAYKEFLDKTGASHQIDALLASLQPEDLESLEEVSRKIREFIEQQPMPDNMAESILAAYHNLRRHDGSSAAKVAVAVRSSATAEDLPSASFAGQQDTFLNTTARSLLKNIQRCWSSLFTPRAIAYRTEKGFAHDAVLISVAVQEMVTAQASGVMFTCEPVGGDQDKLVINAAWGLGEAVVSGQITPDEYLLDKSSLKILKKHIPKKSKQLVSDANDGIKWQSIPEDQQQQAVLDDETIERLGKYGLMIEGHYQTPQDIEWALDSTGQIYILQARPETVHSTKALKNKPHKEAAMGKDIIVKGLGVSPGQSHGRARILLSVKDIAQFQPGDVLVTEMTTPDWVPAMKIAAAVITNSGGKTCHAAIVSRELGVPCVVGTEKATEVIEDGQVITVNGQRGLVFEGVPEPEDIAIAPSTSGPAQQPITATKVFVNLSIPEIAQKVAAETQADGVGLLRAEHLMLGIGKHPRLLVEEGGKQVMIDTFADGIAKVAEAFFPGPVIYRFLDFKPDEFLELPGGETYEKDHVGPNPMIGYRGQYRYMIEDDIFRMELQAIKHARDTLGFNNIWVMLPFVRTRRVFRQTVEVMRQEGLDHKADPDFQLWIMVEVPSACLMIEEFCQEGIDGVSFGTNDLTMLVLGVDRNDASVQSLYDERNLGVLRAIAYTIAVCRKHGVTTSICGQAPSVYPDYLEFMIRCGCTSISVNPDTVVSARRSVAMLEHKIQKENALGVASHPRIAKIPMEQIFFWKFVEA